MMSTVNLSAARRVAPLSRCLTAGARPSACRLRKYLRSNVIAMSMDDPDEGRSTGGGGISRDREPDQYWSPKTEGKGANPIMDPVAIIGIFAIFFPFLFVLIAIATGAIDTSVYR